MIARVPVAPARPSFSAIFRRYEGTLLSAASVAALLIVWEYAVASGRVSPIFFSTPSRIFTAFVDLVVSGEIWRHLRISALEFFVGMLLATVLGIPIGFAAALWKRVGYVVEPILAALYATPTIALIPLMIVWFGIGIWDKIVVVFLGAFFQIAISTISGLKLVDPKLLRVARSYGASRARIFRTVLLPASVPFILIGLRLGISRGLVGVVVAEFVAANSGIGFMISQAGSAFQTARVFVGIIFIALLGIAGTWLVRLLERRFERWRPRVGAA